MPQPHCGGAENSAAQIASERIARTTLIRIEQRLARLKRVAVGCTRLSVIVLGVLAFHWSTFVPIDAAPLALAITLGCLGLALGYSSQYAGWPTLALDSLAIFCLLYGTGRADSPLLALTLAPILIGGLLGNSNGVLAGTATGVSIFLVVSLTHQAPLNALTFDLVLLQISCGLAVSWLWRGASRLLATVREDLCVPHEATHHVQVQRSTDRIADLNYQIAECTTLEQLARLAADRAAAISGVPAQVDLTGRLATSGSESVDRGLIQIIIPSEDIRGTITLHSAPCALSLAQRDAIEHLACVAGQRAAVLRHVAWQRRQRAAVAALWEISGLLRIASTGQECARHGLMRLAEALELGWLALLSPNQLGALAPFVIARGHSCGVVPTISGAQLRVAAEALRGERPLIRREGAQMLLCLPICLAGHAPIVVVAYDTNDDASTQALLMLFGNLIADRLAADSRLSAQVFELV
jgi:hypothetical protein